MPQLQFWSIINSQGLTASPGEARKRHSFATYRLRGQVYGDSGFRDGTVISTSAIISIGRNSRTVRTATGMVYYLGTVGHFYNSSFPKAEEIFFDIPEKNGMKILREGDSLDKSIVIMWNNREVMIKDRTIYTTTLTKDEAASLRDALNEFLS